MNINPLQPSRSLSEIPLEKLAEKSGLTDQQKIGEASRQFEAALLRQILSEARKPVFQSTLTEKSAVTSIYDDLVTSQLAESISHSGDFGLARGLTQQLQPRTKSPEAHE